MVIENTNGGVQNLQTVCDIYRYVYTYAYIHTKFTIIVYTVYVYIYIPLVKPGVAHNVFQTTFHGTEVIVCFFSEQAVICTVKSCNC